MELSKENEKLFEINEIETIQNIIVKSKYKKNYKIEKKQIYYQKNYKI